jgi:hypothetical protein
MLPLFCIYEEICRLDDERHDFSLRFRESQATAPASLWIASKLFPRCILQRNNGPKDHLTA